MGEENGPRKKRNRGRKEKVRRILGKELGSWRETVVGHHSSAPVPWKDDEWRADSLGLDAAVQRNKNTANNVSWTVRETRGYFSPSQGS